jgi:myosin heavy subunit
MFTEFNEDIHIRTGIRTAIKDGNIKFSVFDIIQVVNKHASESSARRAYRAMSEETHNEICPEKELFRFPGSSRVDHPLVSHDNALKIVNMTQGPRHELITSTINDIARRFLSRSRSFSDVLSSGGAGADISRQSSSEDDAGAQMSLRLNTMNPAIREDIKRANQLDERKEEIERHARLLKSKLDEQTKILDARIRDFDKQQAEFIARSQRLAIDNEYFTADADALKIKTKELDDARKNLDKRAQELDKREGVILKRETASIKREDELQRDAERLVDFEEEFQRKAGPENEIQRDPKRIAEIEEELQRQEQRIAELEQELQRQEQRIAELEQDLNARIAELEQELQSQEQRIAELEHELQRKEERITELEAELQHQDAGTAEREEQVKRDAELLRQQAEKLSKHEASVAERERSLEEQWKKFESLKNALHRHGEEQAGRLRNHEEDLNARIAVFKAREQEANDGCPGSSQLSAAETLEGASFTQAHSDGVTKKRSREDEEYIDRIMRVAGYIHKINEYTMDPETKENLTKRILSSLE